MLKLKKVFKSTIAFAIIGAILFGLCGCNGNNKQTAMEDDESKPYEIIWYYIGNSGNVDLPEIEAKVNEYLKEKINATVKMTALDWGPYHEKMSNVMSSGEKYDLRWLNVSSYQSQVYKGAYMDIDELFSKYAPKTRALLGEDFLKGCMIDGKLYAIPANKDKAHYSSIFYRKDIADKHGLDLSNVKTWEEMYPFYEIIKEKEPNMYPYAMSGGRNPWDVLSGYEDVTGSVLAGFLPSSDKVQNLYASKEFEKYAKMAREMYEKGYIYQDCAVEDNAETLISQGRVFARVDQSKPGKLEELNAKSDFELAEIQLTKPVTNQNDVLGSMMAIPVSCENPVRVMKFVELLNTDKYLNNLINFGIENKHYKKVDDNRITIIKDSGYENTGMQWVFGNIFENYLYDGESDTKFEELDAFNKSSEYSQYMGFMPNLESVKIQMSSCRNVSAEFSRVLTYGTVDIDTMLPQFLEQLKHAGIDEVVTEIQRQYDEWKANN